MHHEVSLPVRTGSYQAQCGTRYVVRTVDGGRVYGTYLRFVGTYELWREVSLACFPLFDIKKMNAFLSVRSTVGRAPGPLAARALRSFVRSFVHFLHTVSTYVRTYVRTLHTYLLLPGSSYSTAQPKQAALRVDER